MVRPIPSIGPYTTHFRTTIDTFYLCINMMRLKENRTTTLKSPRAADLGGKTIPLVKPRKDDTGRTHRWATGICERALLLLGNVRTRAQDFVACNARPQGRRHTMDLSLGPIPVWFPHTRGGHANRLLASFRIIFRSDRRSQNQSGRRDLGLSLSLVGGGWNVGGDRVLCC